MLDHVGRNPACRTEFVLFFNNNNFMKRGELFLIINNNNTFNDLTIKTKEFMI